MATLRYLLDNPDQLLMLQQLVCSLLAGVFRAIGWLTACRILGTFTTIDGGRVVKWAVMAWTWFNAWRKHNRPTVPPPPGGPPEQLGP